jgi:hypothetical protein
VLAFRERLIRTLRAIQPELDVPGVVIVGSEVPNLIEPGAASTLVVSEDVDIAVPLGVHADVVAALADVEGLSPSIEEPSVWLPGSNELIEVNFLGVDSSLDDPTESYPFEHSSLPLMVFGALSWAPRARTVDVDGVRAPLPSLAGLLLEKLATDRSGLKGDRDLLVALGILMGMSAEDEAELARRLSTLPHGVRRNMAANAGLLSVLGPSPGVPDPTPHRARLRRLLELVEAV